jgi:hypothetical protein
VARSPCWPPPPPPPPPPDAGFGSVQTFEPPLDPTNLLYLCAK